MNSRLMPQNNGESDFIWLFLTLETPTREVYVAWVPTRESLTQGCTKDCSKLGLDSQGLRITE